MKALELRAKAKKALEAAQAIRSNWVEGEAPSAEDLETIKAHLAEKDALLAQADVLDSLEASEALEGGASDDSNSMGELDALLSGGAVPAQPVNQEAAERGGWDNMGEFAAAVANHFSPDKQISTNQHNRLFAAASGMNQGTGSDGGFTVPKSFSSKIWDGLRDPEDSLLARCDLYPVEGESLEFNANAETSRVTGSRYGGARGYWMAEADQYTGTKPKFRKLKLEPHELGVFVYATDKLLRNAGASLEEYLNKMAGEEITWLVNEAIINGSGVGQPLGILNSSSLVSVTGAGGADTLLQADVSAMWARLHPRARKNAVWLHNVDIEPQLDQMVHNVRNEADSDNVGGLQTRIYNPDKNTIKGRPLIPIEQCATVGDVGDLILADLSGYCAGIGRGGVKSDTSIHLRFDYNEKAFRFIFDCDGQPWMGSALTPANGSNTLSTHVALATRS